MSFCSWSSCQGAVVPEAPKHFCRHREAKCCRAIVALGRVRVHGMLENYCAVMGRGSVCWKSWSGCLLAVKYIVFLER